MATSPEFVQFALDLLAPLGAVHARRMFGGHGLYCRGVFFALLDDDELFLKTDALTLPRFVEAGCRRWSYGRMEETSYFRPPDAAHEDPEAMLPWARLALDAALRAQAERARRAAARAGARGEQPAAKAAPAGRARPKEPAAKAPPSRRRPASRRRGRRGR